MARAVVESIGFAIRDVLDVIAEVGCHVDSLRVSGTQSRNLVLNGIKADITGKRILVLGNSDAELVGCACVGMASLGQHASVIEAAESCVQIVDEIEPNRDLMKIYDDLFHRYRRIYPWINEKHRAD